MSEPTYRADQIGGQFPMGDNVRDGSDRDHSEERQTRRPDSRRLATDSALASGHVIQRIDVTPLPKTTLAMRSHRPDECTQHTGRFMIVCADGELGLPARPAMEIRQWFRFSRTSRLAAPATWSRSESLTRISSVPTWTSSGGKPTRDANSEACTTLCCRWVRPARVIPPCNGP